MSRGLIEASIGKGLESFVDSYNSTRTAIRQQAESDETRALRRRQMERDEEADKASSGMKLRETKFKEAQEGLEYDDTAGKYNRVGDPSWKQKAIFNDGLIRARDTHRGAGKQLPTGEVNRLAEGDQMTGLMSDIAGKITSNKDTMGPWSGRVASLNPYNTKAQIFDAEMKMAAQKIGTYLEGGKMTDKDVPKYRAMLPNITDTPEVAEGKRAAVEDLLRKKRENDALALQKGGYRTKGLMNVAPVAPKVAAPPATKATPVPGAIITRKDGKRFQVGADGESLTEIR